MQFPVASIPIPASYSCEPTDLCIGCLNDKGLTGVASREYFEGGGRLTGRVLANA